MREYVIKDWRKGRAPAALRRANLGETSPAGEVEVVIPQKPKIEPESARESTGDQGERFRESPGPQEPRTGADPESTTRPDSQAGLESQPRPTREAPMREAQPEAETPAPSAAEPRADRNLESATEVGVPEPAPRLSRAAPTSPWRGSPEGSICVLPVERTIDLWTDLSAPEPPESPPSRTGEEPLEADSPVVPDSPVVLDAPVVLDSPMDPDAPAARPLDEAFQGNGCEAPQGPGREPPSQDEDSPRPLAPSWQEAATSWAVETLLVRPAGPAQPPGLPAPPADRAPQDPDDPAGNLGAPCRSPDLQGQDLQSLQGPPERPAQARVEPTTSTGSSETHDSSGTQHGSETQHSSGRDPGAFAVSYQGAPIGFFKPQSGMSAQEALVRVAGELAARRGFDAQGIELHALAPVPEARVDEGGQVVATRTRSVRLLGSVTSASARKSPRKTSASRAQPKTRSKPASKTRSSPRCKARPKTPSKRESRSRSKPRCSAR